ncbi:MAG: 16S rRNA (cytidine(1402)-2'-O)-methyltransferase [Candidatus Levybacteria bacterium]|nr:16S rRNA (cytidine(1402)-2'-O)-methyltransferase [Candidatus Levybacteria bacterium]
MGNLYIVATPIGNLQDLSLRAMEVLKRVEFIACEDTRRCGLLIKHIGRISPPTLLSYYEENELTRIPQIINVLKNGLSVALVSDAGTPTISDPGFKLVRQCIELGIKVESIPGPSAVISALVSSGLPTDKFLFVGYLPRKPGNRAKLLNNISSIVQIIKLTIIIFEAPHRLVKTLEELKEIFGEIDIVIARELTKIHEEIRREKISESISHFEKKTPKGEFVLLFHLEIPE